MTRLTQACRAAGSPPDVHDVPYSSSAERQGHVTPTTRKGDDGHMSAPQQKDGDPAQESGTPRSVITNGMPSRAAMPALSTLIRAAPPWVTVLNDGAVDAALSGHPTRAETSRTSAVVT